MLPTKTNLKDLINKGETPVEFPRISDMSEKDYRALKKADPEVAKQYVANEANGTYELPEYIWSTGWRQHGPHFGDPNHPQYITTTVGGSDVGALFDGSELSKRLTLYEGQKGSKFHVAADLWASKVGLNLMPDDRKYSDDVFFIGHNEEESTRKTFLRLWQNDHPEDIIELEHNTHMYQCGRKDEKGNLKYPFALVTPDDTIVINGTRGLLELKTCQFGSEDYATWKKGRIPLSYYLQVVYYMGTLNLPFAYIVVKWGISLTSYSYIYVERDREIEDLVFDMVSKFVECVETNTEPSVTGQNIDLVYAYYLRKFGPMKPDAEPLKLDKSFKEVLMDLDMMNAEIKKSNEKIDELKKQRKQLIVDKIFPEIKDLSSPYMYVEDDDEEIRLTLTIKPSDRVDTERLKKERPDIFDRYSKCEPKLDTTLFKKEEPDLAKKYIKEPAVTEAYKDTCKIKVIKK